MIKKKLYSISQMKTNQMMHLFTSGTSPQIRFIPSVKISDNLHVELSVRRNFYECPLNLQVK